jgi:hypothetical protein
MESKIIFYQNQDSNVVINVTYFEDNFWLTQRLIAQLFGVEVPAINKHLNNIFEENELDKETRGCPILFGQPLQYIINRMELKKEIEKLSKGE